MTDAETYFRAMRSGSHDTCTRIEERHGLYGYPPELVSVGLQAVADGKDAHEAIDSYLQDGAQSAPSGVSA